MAGTKPLSARQRLAIRVDQTKTAIAAAERALARGADRDALRELTFARALLVGACTEVEILAAPEPFDKPRDRALAVFQHAPAPDAD